MSRQKSLCDFKNSTFNGISYEYVLSILCTVLLGGLASWLRLNPSRTRLSEPVSLDSIRFLNGESSRGVR
jgi:hypothetical protein